MKKQVWYLNYRELCSGDLNNAEEAPRVNVQR